MSAGALRIAVCCYPTFGGSGVIATEIALGMAARGHRVHLFAYDRPARLGPDVGDAPDGLMFHRVEPRDYPVFHQPPYELALASRLVDVAHREGLDVVHVHYAVPHATCAFLAKSMLAAEGVAARDLPRVVTTLHGTDITLVGSDASYRPITRFSIAASDVVTTPSAWLRDTTRALLGLEAQAIEVVPNFVDVHRFAPPLPSSTSRARPAQDGVARLVHVSNFRAVKRVPDVVRVFAGVRAARPAHLTLVGDGPARAEAEALADALGVRADVTFAGELHEVRGLLAEADLFLMPSASESFGVAALEAQAMGVPVIASDAGGLPEVVAHGETGWLLPIGDVAGMTAAALRLLDAPALWHRLAHAARARAVARFEMQAVLDRYEALYRASLR